MNQNAPHGERPGTGSGGLRPLRLYTASGTEERHASWLELFFDLVFVVAVAALAEWLHHHLTLAGLVTFTALFVPVWWLWLDFSYYADQFDPHNWSFKLVLLSVMFGIIVLAQAIPEALGSGSVLFAATYATLRGIIIGLYLWAWRHVSESRELTARYALSFSLALAVWLFSIWVPAPLRFWLWGLALLIEIGNGPLTYLTIRQVPAQVSHMDERFGLFVIIVLGEAVVAVSAGVTEINWDGPALLTALGGFGVAVCLWLLYFIRADAAVINRALRSDRRALFLAYVYGYSHFFVFAGITAAGVGIEAAIPAAAAGQGLPLGARSVLCGGVIAFLLAASALQWASPRSLPALLLASRLAAAGWCAALALLGGVLSPLALVLLIGLALVSLVGLEVRGPVPQTQKALE